MKTRQQKNKEKDLISRLRIQKRKEFFSNIKKVCELYDVPELYEKLSERQRDDIYKNRFYEVDFLKAGDAKIPAEELNGLIRLSKFMLKNYIVTLNDGIGQISIDLHLTVASTLVAHVERYADELFPGLPEIKQKLLAYGDCSEYNQRVIMQITAMLMHLSMWASDLSKSLISFEYSPKYNIKTACMKQCFYIHGIAPFKKTFLVDNNPRPAIRIGWTYIFSEFDWAQIRPSQIGITEGEDKPMEIYIQLHALNRLKERLELPTGLMHFAVLVSIQHLQYHWDSNNKILIDYYYINCKVGYLVASIQENCILIHTFLFLTNSGTPEGKKLFKLTGLKKMDKKYLSIDKLSSVRGYDIKANDYVKNIFIKAGCNSVLDIPDNIEPEQIKSINVDIIENYIKRGTSARITSSAKNIST
jgi:hypothetical protein